MSSTVNSGFVNKRMILPLELHLKFESLKSGISGEFGKAIQMLALTGTVSNTMQNLKTIVPTVKGEFGYYEIH